MKKHIKPSAIPIYGVALLWLLYTLVLPLYRLWHFMILLLLSCGLFLFLRKAFPGKEYYVAEPEPSTGNEELDQVIQQGHEAMNRLRDLNIKIDDLYISHQLEQMETITARIFRQVKAHPDLLPQIRKFMSYYLPTTIRLLENYHELDSSGAGGKEITESKQKIVGMLDTVVSAFQRQLDALFSARTIDINAEVQVLETMMTAEGLKDISND